MVRVHHAWPLFVIATITDQVQASMLFEQWFSKLEDVFESFVLLVFLLLLSSK